MINFSKTSNNLLTLGLMAPMVAGVVGLTSLPANADSGVPGVVDIAGSVRFDPTPGSPAEFWTAAPGICTATGCEIAITGIPDQDLSTPGVQNHFSFLIGSEGSSMNLYDLVVRPDGSGASSPPDLLPSLSLDSDAFKQDTAFGPIGPNTIGPDMVASGKMADMSIPGQLLLQTLIPVDGDPYTPFFTLGLESPPANPTDPEKLAVKLLEIESFIAQPLSPTTNEISLAAKVWFDKILADGTILKEPGVGSLNATFVTGQNSTSFSAQFVAPKVPEPTSILGLAFVMGLGSLSLKKTNK